MKTPSGPPPDAGLAPGRRKLFTIVLALVPLLVVAAAEIGLRAADYGGDLRLVVRVSVGGKEFYSINRDVARRYFAGSGTTIPEPSDDRFSLVKGKNTRRIFCIGESTMQGFPYEYNATAPSFLRDRLQAMFPGYTIEVVNVGLSAVGSLVVEDFLEELAHYEPDLFLVYLGHNEFYGVYGSGSAVGAARPWMTRLAVSLLRFRTYLALRDGYLWIRSRISGNPVAPDGSLMGQMAGTRAIPFNGPLYRETRATYDQNLRSIIHTAREHGIPIVFSSLVSNILDQKPFVELFAEETAPADRERWTRLMAQGDSLAAENVLDRAIAAYTTATRIDTQNAAAFYALGRTLVRAERYAEARPSLERARDCDGLRFRASGDFQKVLLDACAGEGVPVARVDSAFEASSPHGLIGGALILEHLHPNVDGYFLMARTWAEALRREHLLFPAPAWEAAHVPPDSALLALSTVSAFDRLTGKIKIDLLMQRWPFVDSAAPVTFRPADEVEALVYRYVRGPLAWSDARYELAELYASRGLYDAARNECRAVARLLPFSYQPLLRIAELYRRQGDARRARTAYNHCIAVEDNPYARMKLALLDLEEDHPDSARTRIERALNLVGRGIFPMGVDAQASARYLLGGAYAQLGHFAEAREQLQRSLALQPGLTEARELLDRIARQSPPHRP